VKLNPFATRRADPFHDKLRLADEVLTGVTRFTGTSTAPNAGDTVLRQATVGELALDQETKGGLLHEGLLGCGSGAGLGQPDSPGSWRNRRQPKKAEVQAY
jgi:hypothetical protein